MACDVFLKITGVDGESRDSKHAKWIELASFSWGGSNKGRSSVGGGMAAGKAALNDFVFQKMLDVSSPKIIEACCSGEVFGKATVEVCRTSLDKKTFLKFEFEHLLVSSYATGGTNSDNGIPVEQISFNFSKVMVTYSPLDLKGNPTGNIQSSWDLKTMTGI